MDALSSYLFVLVSTVIAVALLGIAAGFSPSLYITQVVIASKLQKRLTYRKTTALLAGVLFAIILLVVLFQIFHIDSVVRGIDVSENAVTVGSIFNIIVGVGFIAAGSWYLRSRKPKKAPDITSFTLPKASILFSTGFVRTFLSISGITATYLTGNIIASASNVPIERFIYTIVFFCAAIIPFVAILFIIHKNPNHVKKLSNKTQGLLDKVNYRLTVGVIAIIFGSCIIMYHLILMVL